LAGLNEGNGVNLSEQRTESNESAAASKQNCSGCGILLQGDHPSKPGYVPNSTKRREHMICQRCFRIKHYNEASSVAVDQDEFLRLLGGIAHQKGLVVHIADIFDFEGSLISGLQRFVGSNPVLLVVNKMDLLPKALNPNRLVNWIQKQAKDQGLKVMDVVLCSARKNFGFERVIETIGQHRKGQDVFVVGATNVGKSTLINRLIHDYSDLDAELELTTSPYPGTTLDLVKIPLDDGKHIVDTPGIVYKHRMTEVVAKADLAAVMPDKPIKPKVYQLEARQTLFFGALARFDFAKGAPQSFTCYISNAINIHRTKLDRADELYADHRGELLQPPPLERLDQLPEWTRHSIRIPRGSQSDVYISGLGWIACNSDAGAELDVYAPKGIKVMVRPSLI
jgi:30S ribosome assembly GTPase